LPKDEYEGNSHHVIQNELFTVPCADRGLPLLKADCGSCLLQPSSCPSGMSAENGLEKSGFSEHQNKSLPEVKAEGGMQCLYLKDSLTTQELTESQVRLRKKKVRCIHRSSGSGNFVNILLYITYYFA
jgi:hypothetical protein